MLCKAHSPGLETPGKKQKSTTHIQLRHKGGRTYPRGGKNIKYIHHASKIIIHTHKTQTVMCALHSLYTYKHKTYFSLIRKKYSSTYFHSSK